MIQKTYDDKEPQLNHSYEVTPEKLRMWADRLEKKKAFAVPGQIIRYQFASDAELFWDPGISTTQYLDRSSSVFCKQRADELVPHNE